MKLDLTYSGGLANLRIAGQVDTSELSEELAQKIEAAFTSEQLQAAQEAEVSPLMMDSQQYELTILPENPGGEARKYKLDDAALPDEMLDVLDELRGILVREIAAGKDS